MIEILGENKGGLHILGKKKLKPKCTVQLENNVQSFDEFVVVGYDRNKANATLTHNTDVMTLALGLEMIKHAFLESYKVLDDKEKEIVDAYLQKVRGTNE